ncbi:MAG TPA: mandelate racemase/muconate lactonizing enzyme family protein [Acidimicrobiales bacterium]|nr:mandelate racemase/muconate lactonizing enzyme family protein [Acidimicrobiales bacterium]
MTARALQARPARPVTFAGGFWDAYSCVLVEVHTDEGVVGYGEAIARAAPQMAKAVVESLLAPVVVGQDPRNIGGLWTQMVQALRRFGHARGLVMEAISGVDVALWDLVGKLEGRPISQLLYGAGRTEVPVYASSVYIDDPEVMCQQAKEQVDAGFTMVKVKIGRGRGREDRRRDIDALRAIRDTVGPSIELFTDANSAYDAATAIRVAREFEDIDIGWLEEPVPPDDLAGYARIHEMTSIPLARGETDFGMFDFTEVVNRRLVDVLQPDLGRCGGVTPARQLSELAFHANLDFAPHTGFSGGISHLVALHVGAAAPALAAVEYMFIDIPLKHIFAEPFPRAVDGVVTLPTGPGLGLDLDWDAIDRFTLA